MILHCTWFKKSFKNTVSIKHSVVKYTVIQYMGFLLLPKNVLLTVYSLVQMDG